MPLHDEATLSLWADLKAQSGETVTYAGGGGSVELTAVPAQTRHDADTYGNFVVSEEERDWIVLASDLVLDGEAVRPSVGDGVTTPAGDTYTVGIPQLERHWDWVGQARLLYRIHTYLSSTD